jgi:hypothetical protein
MNTLNSLSKNSGAKQRVLASTCAFAKIDTLLVGE